MRGEKPRFAARDSPFMTDPKKKLLVCLHARRSHTQICSTRAPLSQVRAEGEEIN